jgi:hypothetical protein
MPEYSRRLFVWIAALAAGVVVPLVVHSQDNSSKAGSRSGPAAPTLGLDNGTLDFERPTSR